MSDRETDLAKQHDLGVAKYEGAKQAIERRGGERLKGTADDQLMEVRKLASQAMKQATTKDERDEIQLDYMRARKNIHNKFGWEDKGELDDQMLLAQPAKGGGVKEIQWHVKDKDGNVLVDFFGPKTSLADPAVRKRAIDTLVAQGYDKKEAIAKIGGRQFIVGVGTGSNAPGEAGAAGTLADKEFKRTAELERKWADLDEAGKAQLEAANPGITFVAKDQNPVKKFFMGDKAVAISKPRSAVTSGGGEVAGGKDDFFKRRK
jgi:hypothetical protein